MNDPATLLAMARALLPVAEAASRVILDVYAAGFDVELKADDSPVTRADKASDALIRQSLEQLYPDIPVLSEESAHAPWEVRRHWPHFFLVDPLDGTKEFIKRNGEFTINIALVQGREPLLGVIRVPVRKVAYFGGPGLGAFRMADGAEPQRVSCAAPGPQGPVMLVSRSHPSPELAEYAAARGVTDVRETGAAYKFCRLAEGTAQLYPRFNPTMEWDTAAGQALLAGAGGAMSNWDGSPFLYNKESLRNGGFIATGGMPDDAPKTERP